MDMTCPSCSSASVEVLETRAPDKGTFRRRRRCKVCAARWTTTERVDRDSITTGSSAQPLPVGENGPLPVGNSDATGSEIRCFGPTGSVLEGGKGGGLPSSSGSVSGSGDPDPSHCNSTQDLRAHAPGPFKARPVVHVGSVTLDFLRVYDRYPNKHRKVEASQVFQDLAAQWPGGEKALADEIVAAFDAGFLKRHPYSGLARHRPKLEDVLAGLRWQEPESAPDDDATVVRAGQSRDVRVGHVAAEVKPRPSGKVAL